MLKRFKSSFLALAFLLPIFSCSPGYQLYNNFSRESKTKKEFPEKKTALALITTYDSVGATKGMEKMFEEDFSDINNYNLYNKRTKNIKEIKNFPKEYRKLKTIDALILAYHGKNDLIIINDSETIDSSNIKKIFKDYNAILSKNAIIILYSCNTGSEENNIAKKLSDVTNRDVIAPKLPIIPETYLKKENRTGEFTTDKNGRLTFDYDHFDVYFEMFFRRFPYLVMGTTSHGKFGKKRFYKDKCEDFFLFIDKKQKED